MTSVTITPIAFVRALNVFLTSINTGIAAVALPDPWNIIAPLILGATIQSIAELLNSVTTTKPATTTIEAK